MGVQTINDVVAALDTTVQQWRTDEEQATTASSSNAGVGLKGDGVSGAVPVPSPDSSGHQPATEFHLTRTGAAMGTAGYMSPEQVRGDKVDARTDLFSYGLVLYEMATGQRAFSGDTATIIQEAILSESPAAAHELNAAIPLKLEQIINHAIEKDREQRYQSAAEMRDDLQSLTDQSRGSESGKPRVSSRWKWLAASAVVCIAVIVGALYWRSHKSVKLTERDTIVLADFANSTGDPIFDGTLKQALSIQLEQSPFLNTIVTNPITHYRPAEFGDKLLRNCSSLR